MSTTDLHSHITVHLEPEDNNRLANLCGRCDEHLRQLEEQLHIEINNRGHEFQLVGDSGFLDTAKECLNYLYTATEKDEHLTPAKINMLMHDVVKIKPEKKQLHSDMAIKIKRGKILPKSSHQAHYVKNMESFDINFGIGPAGTGKTYLAVACAVKALEEEHVQRIILVRPAVEAGERLGFLPGDLAQKVDPYLRPLYDALYEMMGLETVNKLIEKNIIEIAPLAYMRGRTLNDAFIILDESQNTTKEQMKMFLTRIGFGSKAVITGDVTQIDLPRGTKSGLKHAKEVLCKVPVISFTHFDSHDVIRHPVVQSVVQAFHEYEKKEDEKRK